jgi:hypothetical protein
MNPIAKRGIASLVAAVILLSSLVAAVAEEPQPEIFIPVMKFDFGDLFEQKTFEYTFVVKNRGKADLLIDNVKPG